MEEKINENFDTSVGYYLDDIDNIQYLCELQLQSLLDEILVIIKKINKLLQDVDCVEFYDNKRLWIDDRVRYCLDNCNNLNKLNELKVLYADYVSKRNIFIENNLKFVIRFVFDNYRYDNISYDDIIQYGNIGLIRAIETYDPKFGVKFLTYASYWIKQNININCKKMMYSLKVSIDLYSLYCSLNNARNDLSINLGRKATNVELAKYLNISMNKLNLLYNTFSDFASLDEPVYTEDEECTRKDLLIDQNVDIESDIFNIFCKLDLYNIIENNLNGRHKEILEYRFNLGLTLGEISKKLGISTQRVSQLEMNALRRLRKVPQIKSMIEYLR